MPKLTLDLEVSNQLAERLADLPQERVNQAATVALAAFADKTDRDDDTVAAALAVALSLADSEAAMRLSVDDVEKTTQALFTSLQTENEVAHAALAAASEATRTALNAFRDAQANAKGTIK